MKKIIILLSICVVTGTLIHAQSPYIYKVFDYRPAPGQWINELPEYEAGDTQEEMNRKVEENIKGENKIAVSLGAYGGYIVFGFDHPVVNVSGAYDFKIWGNAILSGTNPDRGSSEPGIVMVSYDENGNGLPDDAWYELAGSEYYKPETIKNYQITYYKPDENKIPTPDPDYPFLNDTTYIKWRSNQGDEGYVSRNTFHLQPYFPQWIDDETLLFEGTKLTDNSVDENGTGTNYVQYTYPFGYADNYPNSDDRANFNIEWAVDADGNPVHLSVIHFVKVYSAVNQYCGWLGETSTEIMGAEDRHLNTGINQPHQNKNTIRLLKNPIDDMLYVELTEPQTIHIYNTLGQLVFTEPATEGINIIDCSHLPKGLYIIISNHDKIKFIKQ
jgi:hypothetical protein